MDDKTGKNRRSTGASAPPVSHLERLRLEREYNVLVQLAARCEMGRADSPFYSDERFIEWLDRELGEGGRSGEGWSQARILRAARRIEAKVEAARLRVACVSGEPPADRALVAGTVAQVRELAASERAAPELDLAAAAGAGRELWDEPCERWIRVPRAMPRGEYLALRVSGDSMTPLVHDGDTVLVKLDPKVSRETVVVARLPEGGYVIKRVAQVTPRAIELASLNPAHPPVSIPPRSDAVVGTVMLRWCPHEVTEEASA